MTVNYTLAENKGRALNGEVVYIGQLIHNGVLDMDAMSRDYAAKFNVSEATARFQHLTPSCRIARFANDVDCLSRMGHFTCMDVIESST